MWTSWRILVSVLTVPFPWEASSRIWGYEVFFPVAQLVLAAPLFILVMASQQKRSSSSREVRVLSLLLSRSPGTAPLSLLQLGQNSPLPGCHDLSAPPEVLDWVWVPAGISGYLKRRLELLWKFLSCSREFLHFCASSFWGILSLKGKLGVWSQLGLLIASPSTYWKLVDTLSVAALNFKELPVSLDEGRRNLLQFVLMQKPELGSWFLILKPGRMMD